MDASWTATNGAGFARVVTRNSDGLFTAGKSYQIKASTAAAAETSAILYGCEVAIFLGLDLVIMESDSKESIDCLRDPSTLGCWEAFSSLTKTR